MAGGRHDELPVRADSTVAAAADSTATGRNRRVAVVGTVSRLVDLGAARRADEERSGPCRASRRAGVCDPRECSTHRWEGPRVQRDGHKAAHRVQ